jgi:two-component system, NarL family, response regulator YdfI
VIRVFIVAPSSLARSGLKNLVARRDVKVVGNAANFDSLADQLADAEPDVVLIDGSAEPPDSILEPLKSSEIASEIPVVVLVADWASTESLAEALRAGVRAVLPEDVSSDQIFTALQAAGAGLVILHPQEVSQVFRAATAPLSQPLAELPEPLTRREREVLQMLASGLANKEIGARLNISDHTVKFHVASLLGKLGASGRTEAVALGIRRGLVLL